MLDLRNLKKIHFTGIKGVGMVSLAICAKDLGIEITGSDIKEYFVTDETLKKANISWKSGFSSKNIHNPDLVIFTAAHGGEKNVEVQEAISKNIPVLSHGQALDLFTKNKIGISVAGVGGKSTTSAMLATILAKAGLHPSYAVGVGSINPLGFPAKFDQKGKHFIAEADEYFSSPLDPIAKFLYLESKIAIITNIEFDHPDVYKDLNHTIETFKKFAKKIPKNGLLVACIDSPNVKSLLKDYIKPKQTYGLSERADWQISSINQSEGIISFKLKNMGKTYSFKLHVPGEFNVKNATAAIIVAKALNVPINKIKKGIESFKGTKRRFEFIGEANEIKFYDDYAHHPLEINATLKAAKSWFKNAKIAAVFQPHTYSRTKALFSQFCKCFNYADFIYLAPIYASAREKKDFEVSSQKIVKILQECNKKAFFVKSSDTLAKDLFSKLKKGDIVITMGAGDIFTWHKQIITYFKKNKLVNKLEISKNEPLAPYTSFNIGGEAKYFIKVNNKDEIKQTLEWSKEKGIKYFTLGGGSNILALDKGFNGLVMKIQSNKFKVKHNKITVDSGMPLAKLIKISADNSLSGLEFLAGIPGTVGGAIVGNAGTQYGLVSQTVEKVSVLKNNGVVEILSNKNCQFSYRRSCFSNSSDIVLSVVFKLKKEKKIKIKANIDKHLSKRKLQPRGKSAGSIFKNPPNINAGTLIDKLNLKGKRIGGAIISKEHGNWIINTGTAKASDVIKLVEFIKKRVKLEFNLVLEEEIKYLGE
ncbi:UDP-N-acetylmuramate--L-alanine ligase [Patescibacteria group bacterium]